ncbi:MAG TPA: hypothetical protein DEO65_17855 [Bacillus bacterium]|uniref:Uncharacterized protein n=1 Tax=Siminovitchia fordii TaxID=254759 RepID=A0ABQ4K7U9_9BACI|nr:CoA transferase [Siminovitchia fordii]GIN21819.1 hypothetical protein J1TS3_29530 [Siminovitchia fordii]HBZ11701.1 hypothetical protein [Bacillus sp. (in: firmicutes)]
MLRSFFIVTFYHRNFPIALTSAKIVGGGGYALVESEGAAVWYQVIEFGKFIPGPFVTKVLGDLGAEVIIEIPGTEALFESGVIK